MADLIGEDADFPPPHAAKSREKYRDDPFRIAVPQAILAIAVFCVTVLIGIFTLMAEIIVQWRPASGKGDVFFTAMVGLTGLAFGFLYASGRGE